MEKKISVVLIGVKNMGRAVSFYRSALGLPLKFRTPTFSEFKTGGAVLALEKRAEISAGGPEFAFLSRDIKRDFKNLKNKKVRFFKPLREEPYGWIVMPYDSEGNVFEIVQYKK